MNRTTLPQKLGGNARTLHVAQDTLIPSLRDQAEAAAAWWRLSQESHPTFSGCIQITRINFPLFLIYLHLFSINESWVSRSVFSRLITLANEISRRLTGCWATGLAADEWESWLRHFQPAPLLKNGWCLGVYVKNVGFLQLHTHLQMFHLAIP